MDGLAQTMAGPVGQPQAMGTGVPTVEEVAALLMQGIDPQKLLESGVPEQLIMEAIALLEQQMAAEQQSSVPATPEGQGLAGSLV